MAAPVRQGLLLQAVLSLLPAPQDAEGRRPCRKHSEVRDRLKSCRFSTIWEFLSENRHTHRWLHNLVFVCRKNIRDCKDTKFLENYLLKSLKRSTQDIDLVLGISRAMIKNFIRPRLYFKRFTTKRRRPCLPNSFENYALKSFLGFLFGLLLTTGIFFFLLYQLNCRPIVTTLICCVLGVPSDQWPGLQSTDEMCSISGAALLIFQSWPNGADGVHVHPGDERSSQKRPAQRQRADKQSELWTGGRHQADKGHHEVHIRPSDR
ncbi:hypothetical protein CEXT_762541 [Caerostris extrusa]|uniref:Uncharacterized protein n=1 Tax=Caerostris extrusa TaxID=172846 RepID=A0AAV4S3C2_CAEEX|nr:hypothetical protein CEXT_762541 [Caerostris extrusa]